MTYSVSMEHHEKQYKKYSIRPTMATNNDVASNGGGEILSCHEDPNANLLCTNTNRSKRLSTDAIDEKAEAERKFPASLKSPPQGRETKFSKQEILFLVKAYMRASSDLICWDIAK